MDSGLCITNMEKRITIRLTQELHREVTKAAAIKKQSVNEYLVKLLTEMHMPEPPRTISDEEWDKIINDY